MSPDFRQSWTIHLQKLESYIFNSIFSILSVKSTKGSAALCSPFQSFCRDGRDDGDGICGSNTALKNIVTTVTIVTLLLE